MYLPRPRILTVLVSLLVAAGLSLTALHSFLLYHTLAETFSIVISCGIFIVAWHTRRIADTSFLLFLGTAYLCVGFLDYLHTMAYPGMAVIETDGNQVATQLWVATRYLESVALLVSPVFLKKRVPSSFILGAFALVVTALLVAIFHLELFPRCYIPGQGLTVFKKTSEYVIAALFGAAALLLYRRRHDTDREMVWYIIAAAGVSGVSEILFTLYVDVYGIYNFLGHALKIVSSFFIYRAVLVAQLEKPFETLFRQLKGRESLLRDAKGALEKDVREKEQEIAYRHHALEEIYALATTRHRTLKTLNDRVAVSVARILHVPLVVLYQLRYGKIEVLTQVVDGTPVPARGLQVPCPVCSGLLKTGKPVQYRGDLATRFPDYPCFHKGNYAAYLGVPVLNERGRSVGALCVLDTEKRVFRENEIHIIDIFSRYIGQEIYKRRMEREVRSADEIRLLGQLTSGVAHEVRNPLNAIATISDALSKKAGADSPYAPFVQHIQAQVARLSTLMEDLLAFGRPVRRADFTTVSLHALVSEALQHWRQSADTGRRTIQLHADSQAQECTVRVDTARMQQVIINVLDNALQHTPQDASIDITLHREASGYAAIRVTDTGAGIAEEDMGKLFTPFFSTRKAGTGLGLSIVKSKVAHHGGTVRIANNEPGPGATVTIELPCAGSGE